MAFSVTRLLTVASLALLVAGAVKRPTRAIETGFAESACANANVVSETTVTAGGQKLQLATFDCEVPEFDRRQAEAEPQAATPPNCNRFSALSDSCATSCTHDSGILPPISEDCDMLAIATSIMIDQGFVAPNFVVKKYQMKALTFGTCSYYFAHNDSSCNEAEYSWQKLIDTGKSAGKACFPPVQPFSPEGLCKGSSGVWTVGASHS